jgi:hypothetical protein
MDRKSIDRKGEHRKSTSSAGRHAAPQQIIRAVDENNNIITGDGQTRQIKVVSPPAS